MRTRLIILLSGVLVCLSCKKEALFDSGPVKTKTIALQDYSTIEAENMFEVELFSDSVNKVYITSGENLFKFIKISVSEGVLHLNHDISQSWSREYKKVKLELHTKPFNRINIRKPIKLFNKAPYKGNQFSLVDWGKFSEVDISVKVDYCQIAMSSDNFGQFKVKGKASTAEIWGWGSCSVRADSLVVNNCKVLHRGMGDVYVNVLSKLEAAIDFTGNLYYTGSPNEVILQSKKGSGNLYPY